MVGSWLLYCLVCVTEIYGVNNFHGFNRDHFPQHLPVDSSSTLSCVGLLKLLLLGCSARLGHSQILLCVTYVWAQPCSLSAELNALALTDYTL